MTSTHVLTLGLCLVAFGTTGCSSDDEASDPIVIISQNWADEADPTHTFQFNSADDGEREGTFDGFEQFDGLDVYPLTGTWGNGHIVFTVARPVPVEYTARVTADAQTRFVFESSAGPLVLDGGGG